MNYSVILDANKLGHFVEGARDRGGFTRLADAIVNGRMRVAFGGTQMTVEYDRVDGMMDLVQELERSGQLDRGCNDDVDKEQVTVACLRLHSNDLHIIALARVTGGRILVSGDGNLRKDFLRKDLVDNPRGFIYTKDENWAAMQRRFSR